MKMKESLKKFKGVVFLWAPSSPPAVCEEVTCIPPWRAAWLCRAGSPLGWEKPGCSVSGGGRRNSPTTGFQGLLSFSGAALTVLCQAAMVGKCNGSGGGIENYKDCPVSLKLHFYNTVLSLGHKDWMHANVGIVVILAVLVAGFAVQGLGPGPWGVRWRAGVSPLSV